jgi:FdhD protein
MSQAWRSSEDALRQVSVTIQHWRGGRAEPVQDELAVEEPLELRVAARTDGEPSSSLAAIMRTPGQDTELAAGFLFSEGLLRLRAELVALEPGTDEDGLPSPNVLEVRTSPDIDLARRMRDEGYSRDFAVNASCGVCGKNSVAQVCATLPPLPHDGVAITPTTLYRLPDRLRAEQRVFAHTGGLHAAGLFDVSGALLALREDIGRHNAVDKLIGRAFLDDQLPLSNVILLVSGRLSFEIVLKALAARIPMLAAVSAPSSMAVDLAEEAGITIAAFLRGEMVNVYTHPYRVRMDSDTPSAS